MVLGHASIVGKTKPTVIIAEGQVEALFALNVTCPNVRRFLSKNSISIELWLRNLTVMHFHATPY
jgi:hypothetical protein